MILCQFKLSIPTRWPFASSFRLKNHHPYTIIHIMYIDGVFAASKNAMQHWCVSEQLYDGANVFHLMDKWFYVHWEQTNEENDDKFH